MVPVVRCFIDIFELGDYPKCEMDFGIHLIGNAKDITFEAFGA